MNAKEFAERIKADSEQLIYLHGLYNSLADDWQKENKKLRADLEKEKEFQAQAAMTFEENEALRNLCERAADTIENAELKSDCDSIVKELRNHSPAFASCQWWLDDEDTGYWKSACGLGWCFPEAGPKENDMKYCPGCGKPVAIKEK